MKHDRNGRLPLGDKWRVRRARNGFWFSISPWEWHEQEGKTFIRQRQCGHNTWREALDYADRMAHA